MFQGLSSNWRKIAQDATSQVLIFLSPRVARDIWKFGQDIVAFKLATWFWQRALSFFFFQLEIFFKKGATRCLPPGPYPWCILIFFKIRIFHSWKVLQLNNCTDFKAETWLLKIESWNWHSILATVARTISTLKQSFRKLHQAHYLDPNKHNRHTTRAQNNSIEYDSFEFIKNSNIMVFSNRPVEKNCTVGIVIMIWSHHATTFLRMPDEMSCPELRQINFFKRFILKLEFFLNLEVCFWKI